MRLPSILKDLLPSDSVKQLIDLVNQPNLVSGLKDAAQQLGWKEAWGTTQLQHAMMQTKKWMETFQTRWASENHETLRLGVNATGQLFSTRWSSVPLSSQAISTFAVIAGGYTEPTAITQDLSRVLTGATGATACLVTHNVEQALSLLRQGLPANKRWVIPRADAIRLASGSDLATLLSINDSSVIEAGASNACSVEDYRMAIEAGAGAVLCVEPSRLPSASPSTEHVAIHAAREHRVPVVELLLNGSLIDLSSIEIEAPVVSDRLKNGVDAVVFPGDGWLGGPPCGIIMGKEAFIKPLIDLSVRLGMMAHPLLLGTLHAALVAGKDLDTWKQTPLGLMASNGVENLHQRAKRLAIQLEGLPTINQVAAEVSRFAVASHSTESTSIDSGVVRIEPKGMSAKELQAKLAARETPLWCLSDDRSIMIVLRTVEPSDDQEIVAAFDDRAS